MEKNFSTYQYQKKKKVTRKVLAWVEIMTAQLVTYWVWLIFLKNYWLIAIDLSKQTKLKDPQQINFIGKLLKNTGATMFFIIEKSEETTFEFLQNSVNIL